MDVDVIRVREADPLCSGGNAGVLAPASRSHSQGLRSRSRTSDASPGADAAAARHSRLSSTPHGLRQSSGNPVPAAEEAPPSAAGFQLRVRKVRRSWFPPAPVSLLSITLHTVGLGSTTVCRYSHGTSKLNCVFRQRPV